MKLLSMRNIRIKLDKNEHIIIYIPDKNERLIIENLKDKVLVNHFKTSKS